MSADGLCRGVVGEIIVMAREIGCVSPSIAKHPQTPILLDNAHHPSTPIRTLRHAILGQCLIKHAYFLCEDSYTACYCSEEGREKIYA
jgi:hypothetical protein